MTENKEIRIDELTEEEKEIYERRLSEKDMQDIAETLGGSRENIGYVKDALSGQDTYDRVRHLISENRDELKKLPTFMHVHMLRYLIALATVAKQLSDDMTKAFIELGLVEDVERNEGIQFAARGEEQKHD